MTACLPLYRAYYSFSGLVIAPCNPARGTATRNHLTGRELEYCPEYVNEGAKLLDIAKRASGEYQNERCAIFIKFLAENIKNTLISDGNLIDRLAEKAKGLAELITLEEVDGKIIPERSAAQIIGVSRAAYRKTWAARKLQFLRTLY